MTKQTPEADHLRLRLKEWWSKVGARGWGGLHFQHAALCHRRAWFHLKGLGATNERMNLANAAHEAAYSRDASLTGLLGLAPDRIDWRGRVVEEHKHGKADHECARAQCMFYAAALSAATDDVWTGRLISLSTRTRQEWRVDASVLGWLEELAGVLDGLQGQTVAPNASRISACALCSFAEVCWE